MVGESPFPFPKYRGKSIAHIALLDYPYLAWASDKLYERLLRKEVGRVLFALDSFEPQIECYNECGQKATRFSIAYADRDWLVDDAYWFCPSEKCWSRPGSEGPRCEEPIKFSAMLTYALGGARQQSRARVLKFQEILNSCAGFRGVLNEQSAQKFIDDLVRKTKA